MPERGWGSGPVKVCGTCFQERNKTSEEFQERNKTSEENGDDEEEFSIVDTR